VIPEQYSSEASMCFCPTNNSLYVFFRDYQYDPFALSDCWGVAGQKFSPEGTRLWGDNAKLVVPFMCSPDSTYFYVYVKDAQDDGICLFYQKEYLEIIGPDTMLQSDLYASLLDADGNFLWAENKVPISTCASDKLHFTAGELSNNQWITAWEDNRQDPYQSDYTGIYAQNITIDGNLGPLSIHDIQPVISNGLRCYPNPCNDRLTISYDLSTNTDVILKVTDLQGRCLKSVNAGLSLQRPQTFEIETSFLVPGIYFIELQDGEYTGVLKILKYR